jgi:RNA polymerase sigma-32 factor
LIYQYIAKKIGVSEEAVIKMNTVLMQNDKSMDDVVGAVRGTSVTRFGETLPDPMCGEGSLSNGADKSAKLEIISRVVDSLPEIEKKIITDRYLCDDPKTLRELQSEMSISREWIRKLEMRALDRVKKRLNSDYGITDILDI